MVVAEKETTGSWGMCPLSFCTKPSGHWYLAEVPYNDLAVQTDHFTPLSYLDCERSAQVNWQMNSADLP